MIDTQVGADESTVGCNDLCENNHNYITTPASDISSLNEPIPEVCLYTNGVCSDDSGCGGYGYAIVINNKLSLEGSGCLLYASNQQMELMAIVEGLKVIPSNYQVTIYTNSSYVINAFRKKWIVSWIKHYWHSGTGEPVANRELWEALLKLINKRENIRFVWTKGQPDNKYFNLSCSLARQGKAHLTNS